MNTYKDNAKLQENLRGTNYSQRELRIGALWFNAASVMKPIDMHCLVRMETVYKALL